jgi:hypothetical protein
MELTSDCRRVVGGHVLGRRACARPQVHAATGPPIHSAVDPGMRCNDLVDPRRARVDLSITMSPVTAEQLTVQSNGSSSPAGMRSPSPSPRAPTRSFQTIDVTLDRYGHLSRAPPAIATLFGERCGTRVSGAAGIRSHTCVLAAWPAAAKIWTRRLRAAVCVHGIADGSA